MKVGQTQAEAIKAPWYDEPHVFGYMGSNDRRLDRAPLGVNQQAQKLSPSSDESTTAEEVALGSVLPDPDASAQQTQLQVLLELMRSFCAMIVNLPVLSILSNLFLFWADSAVQQKQGVSSEDKSKALDELKQAIEQGGTDIGLKEQEKKALGEQIKELETAETKPLKINKAGASKKSRTARRPNVAKEDIGLHIELTALKIQEAQVKGELLRLNADQRKRVSEEEKMERELKNAEWRNKSTSLKDLEDLDAQINQFDAEMSLSPANLA